MENKKILSSMTRLLQEGEIEAIEQSKPGGLSAAEIVEVFAGRGIKFSEATFRKYVQLGLLPRSRRVGTKGKHRGSHGLYPVGTIRQINEIKRLMILDYTIEEIRQQFAFVGGELEELRRLLGQLIEKLEASVAADRSGLAAAGIRRRLEEARRTAQDLLFQLEETATRIREQAQVARDAV